MNNIKRNCGKVCSLIAFLVLFFILASCTVMPTVIKRNKDFSGTLKAVHIIVTVDPSPFGSFRFPRDYLALTGWLDGEAFKIIGPRIVQNFEKNGIKTQLTFIGRRTLVYGNPIDVTPDLYVLQVKPASIKVISGDGKNFHPDLMSLSLKLIPPKGNESVWDATYEQFGVRIPIAASDNFSIGVLQSLAENKLVQLPSAGPARLERK